MKKENLMIIREDLESEVIEFELYINGLFERKEVIDNDMLQLHFILTMIDNHDLTDENTLTIYIWNTQKSKNFSIETLQHFVDEM